MKALTLGRRAFFSSRYCSYWLILGLLASSQLCRAQTADESAASSNRQADEAVREALQREVYGLDRDRQQLLSAALASDPNHAAARWQLGYVRSATGEWVQADDAATTGSPALAKYQELRLKKRDLPNDQLALADWCAQQGLKDQERAHLLRVCQLAPDHEIARRRLGFVREGVEWISREDVARRQVREELEKKALEQWTETIDSLIAHTWSDKPKVRNFAMEQIKAIRDPAALPALQARLANRGEEQDLLVVEITAQMTDPAAAVALARSSILSPWLRVRKAALAKLTNYDTEAYVPMLVAALYTPVTSQYRAAPLPNGRIGYHHQFEREGLTRREVVTFDADYRRFSAHENRGFAKVIALGDAAQRAQRLEQEAARQNEFTRTLNERIVTILRTVTGADLPAVPEAWWKWWADQSEVFVEGVKPTATTQHMVSISVADRGLLTTASSSQESMSSPIQPRYDCLAAGTPVWTEQGKVAIEQVRVGDLVLSREVESGELAYKPVIRTTIRPAGQLVKVRAGNETFETSGGHLFWVSGTGWVKSRQLESGMVLHTACGPARVTEVGEGPQAVTYNLVVADFNTYFVGQQKLLSHDNTVRRFSSLAVPGLKAE